MIRSLVITLRLAAALLFTAFNLIPLYGIHAWGWDAFQLLLLYWGETAILFVCTLAHIACVPPALLGTMIVNGKTVPATRLMMVGFFALHGGVFIAGHLLFLCVLFSGAAFKHIHGARDFIAAFLIASGAWSPLLLVALAGALDVLIGDYHPAFVDAFARRLSIAFARPADDKRSDVIGSLVGGLYLRIVIMQVAIIFGAMASRGAGSLAPLVIVIVLKTLADVVTRIGPILKSAPAPAPRPS